MNAIMTTTAPLNYAELERLANSIAKSGLFGIRTPDQAMTLMMIAAAEGRHPALAARDYDIVNGRPTKKAEAMMRDFVQAGGKVEWHALTDALADATFTHPQTGSVRIDWDMKRAQTAFGKKDMYAKFPRQMLRSRVVSEGVRTLWPLATSGMYVEEEISHLPPHHGPTIEHAAPVMPMQARTLPDAPATMTGNAGPTIEHGLDVASQVAAATAAYGPPASEQDKARLLVERKPTQKPTVTQWLDALALELAAAEGSEEVDEILARPEVQQAQDKLRNGARDRLQHILDEAIRRTAQADDTAEAEAGDALFADPETDPFRAPVPV